MILKGRRIERERGERRGGTCEREREKHDRRQSEELKEVMKIRRSRKGAYDKRMRRSTRNTTTLILDLVTLTPAAACPSPPITSVYAHLRAAHRRFNSPRFAPTRLRSLCFPLSLLTYVALRIALPIVSILSPDHPSRAIRIYAHFPSFERSLEKRTSERYIFYSLSLFFSASIEETRLDNFFYSKVSALLTPLDASITQPHA